MRAPSSLQMLNTPQPRLTQRFTIPDGSLIVGSPAKVVRELTEKEKESILANARLYLEKSQEYRAHAIKQA